jgi:hypothetical protein
MAPDLTAQTVDVIRCRPMRELRETFFVYEVCFCHVSAVSIG